MSKDKASASARIEALEQSSQRLEQGLMALYQTADNMARDLITMKEALKLLGNKMDSVVQVISKGETLNDENISKAMVENNVADLKEKVAQLVSNGVLVASETVEANSFIVGEEVEDSGKVINPRIQSIVSAFEDSVKSKIVGAKVGQLVEVKEGKAKLNIQEVYAIQVPAPEQEATTEVPVQA
jgi:exo-beta-1,3-glucanase (GH17 family)